MATSLKVSVTIERDIDSVFETLCDADYIQSKLESIGARNIQIQQAGASGDSAHLQYSREEPAEVPSALKKFVSDWNSLKNSDRWSGAAGGPYRCQYEVDMNGPVKVGGQHTLEDNGSGGTTSTVTMDLSCNIPLVGRKLEQFVAGLAQKGLDADTAFQKKYAEA